MVVFWIGLLLVAIVLVFIATLRADQKRLSQANRDAQAQALARLAKPLSGEHIDAYMATARNYQNNGRLGSEDQLVWHDSPQKVRQVVLYLHGFSASPNEISPVLDTVSRQLGAHYFAPRLTGHGQTGSALGAATAEDWLRDAWFAWTVASSMAERVIMVGSSTGATLATALLRVPEVQARTDAVVFLSPNFGIKRVAARILTWPIGSVIMRWLSGPEWAWKPSNELQKNLWTYRYPVKALHQVQRLVQWTTQRPLVNVALPLHVVQCRMDKTVSSDRANQYLASWEGEKMWHFMPPKEGTNNHVLAGDATRPENNAEMISLLTAFLKTKRKTAGSLD